MDVTTNNQWFLLFLMIITVNSSCFGFGGNEMFSTIYITPSSSIPCHKKPCLTLNQFAINISWLRSNTSLIFLSGNHTLKSTVSFQNNTITNLSMLSITEDSHAIICIPGASFQFDFVERVRIEGLNFIGCSGNRILSVNYFIIRDSTFQGQVSSLASTLEVNESSIIIESSVFVSNTFGICLSLFAKITNVIARVGGAIYANHSNITITESNFHGNSAEIGGAIFSHAVSNITISSSTFTNNQASVVSDDNQLSSCLSAQKVIVSSRRHESEFSYYSGGAIAALQTNLSISSSTFRNNTSQAGDAGALNVQFHSVAVIHYSKFSDNNVRGSGGAMKVAESYVMINNSEFYKNSAKFGGAIQVLYYSVMVVSDSIYSNNVAKSSGGALATDYNCEVTDYGSQFMNNKATSGNGGVLSVARAELTLHSSYFSNNQASDGGGVMYVIQSQITLHGYCDLMYNIASTGGAVYASESTLNVFALLSVMFNTARDSGGGFYLYRSNLKTVHEGFTNISSNGANNSGGGIHAVNSLIAVYCNRNFVNKTTAMIGFTDNRAYRGGALSLASASQLCVQKVGELGLGRTVNVSVFFTSNTADYGEAIYVVDETYFDVCARGPSVMSTTECFIQILSPPMTENKEPSLVSIQFNGVSSSKPAIYGGLLDRCTLDSLAQILIESNKSKTEIDGVTYLKSISNMNNTNMISSLPVRLCFCTPRNQPECRYEPLTINVMKGESFNVSLVAVDQVNHTVLNVKIHSYLTHEKSSLGKGQSTQMTNSTMPACTNFTFNIFSTYPSEQLTMYAEGPCRNVSRSQRQLIIVFRNCSCPTGFQVKYVKDDCECICDSKLRPYFTDIDNSCNNETGLLVRSRNFWITNLGTSGYIIYPHCPFDYCVPPYPNIQINLNINNGSDAQCANNRSGILCSVCLPGLSLSLGSSRCIPCPKDWYKGFIAVIVIAVLAGIILVAFLMILNLTVADGTINGLIFYANIIGANSSTFLYRLSSVKFLSIFVSWLNQEVGFDICFFEGMDTYWKTWLQLAFPSYVIILVVMVIIISEHSMKFSRLIARRNPVATLATLILLSYTMLFRTMITVLSFTNLHYPDGSHKRVWLPDATVEYLSGKHVVLLVVAILILMVGVAYTCTLFFWQWILLYQNKCIFKWIRSQRLCHFIEPYHAPYVLKHRYWTGLLLFVRVALYLVFALNVSGDPGVNLLAITIAVISILSIKGYIGKIYKMNLIDKMEMVCYANIGVFSAVSQTSRSKQIMQISACMSGSISLLLLLAVVVYHTYIALCSSQLRQCKLRDRQLDESDKTLNDISNRAVSVRKPTFSALHMGLPRHGRDGTNINPETKKQDHHVLGGCLKLDDETTDDYVSDDSSDVTTPLLIRT